MSTISSRIEWIDIAKGFGIISVILGHCISREYFLTNFIYSFHMPFFFILSGLCFNCDNINFSLFFKKKVYSLLIPLIFFTFILTFFSAIILDQSPLLLLRGFPHALWFLFILFLSECLAFFNNTLSKKKMFFVFECFLSFGIGYLLKKNDIIFIYSLCSIFYATSFLFIGIMLRRISFVAIISKLNLYQSFIFFVITFFVICFNVSFFHLKINLQSNLISPLLVGIFNSFLGLFMLSFLSLYISKFSFIKNYIIWLGRNTVVIMCVHLFFSVFYQMYIKGCISNVFLDKILHLLFVLLFSIFSVLICNKYLKFFIGKK